MASPIGANPLRPRQDRVPETRKPRPIPQTIKLSGKQFGLEDHRVQPGERLEKLVAERTGLQGAELQAAVQDIASLNNLGSPHKIRAGQTIQLPPRVGDNGASAQAGVAGAQTAYSGKQDQNEYQSKRVVDGSAADRKRKFDQNLKKTRSGKSDPKKTQDFLAGLNKTLDKAVDLSGTPAADRGKKAAELVEAKGEAGVEEIAKYIQAGESREPSVRLKLGRAANLLIPSQSLSGAQKERVAKAVAAGLDRLVSEEASSGQVHKLENGLLEFLSDAKIDAGAKMAMLDSVARHSENPQVRFAAATVLSKYLNKQNNHLEQDKKNLKASYDLKNLGNIPGGPQNAGEYRAELTKCIKQREWEQKEGQPIMARLLSGSSAVGEAEKKLPIGDMFRGYLEKHHNGRENEVARGMMRAMFDPPSVPAMREFKGLVDKVASSSEKSAGYGLGYLIEAGRQEFDVKKQEELDKRSEVAGKAFQVTLAAALGYAAGPAAALLGAEGAGEIADAIGAGLGKLGEETLDSYLSEAGKKHPKEALTFQGLQGRVRQRIADADVWDAYRDAVEHADGDLRRERLQ